MKAVVHLGLAKTGSTSVQQWLLWNTAALSARGIAFDCSEPPECSQDKEFQGLAITARELCGKMTGDSTLKRSQGIHDRAAQRAFAERYSAFFADLVRSHDEDTFVISCEYLGMNTRDVREATIIHNWLGNHFDEVRYVMYLRRQEEWLASSYCERVKRGSTKTLDDLVASSAAQDWHHRAAIWAGAAGQDAVDVRLLEDDVLGKDGLIGDFARIIGTTPEGLAPAERVNESLSAPAAELLRVLNDTIPHTNKAGTKVNPRKRRLRSILFAQDLDMPKVRLDPAQVATVRAANAASNERLRAAFFPDRQELFPPRPEGTGAHRAQTPADVAVVAGNLITEIDRRRRKAKTAPPRADPRATHPERSA